MNTAALIGRLADDPVVTTSKNGTATAKYVLAVRRRGKNTEEAFDFIRCTCFGETADFAEKYFSKGTRVGVIGHIQGKRYENEEGFIVYTAEIVVENQRLQTVLHN